MKFDTLLEKREQLILRLIHHLQRAPKQNNLKELCLLLDLSRATLMRYIRDFNEEAAARDLEVTLVVEGEGIHYRRAAHVPAHALLGFLAESSIKYQILVYLFDRDEFSLQELSQELLISEASLSRQLSALNRLLSEFDLTIRGGRFKGSELQIRYFYFHLFWFSGSALVTEFPHIKQGQTIFLAHLQKTFGVQFPQKQENQLFLWLTICQRRMRLGHLNFKDTYEKMLPYLGHKFYGRLQEVCFTLFNQWAGSFHEGEVMCHFVFLFFKFILPAPKVEQMLAFGGPIKEAASIALFSLRALQETPVLNEEVLYQINQLMGQVYFIKGRLVVAETDFSLYDFPSKYMEVGEELYRRIMTQVYRRVHCHQDDQEIYIVQELTKLIYYLNLTPPKPILIGLALSKDKITIGMTLDSLRQELEKNRSIILEEWQEDEEYNLIISDYLELQGASVYYLHRGLTAFDVAALKELIKEL